MPAGPILGDSCRGGLKYAILDREKTLPGFSVKLIGMDLGCARGKREQMGKRFPTILGPNVLMVIQQ